MQNNKNLHTLPPPPLYVLNKVSACLYTHADTHLGEQTEKTQKTWDITPEKQHCSSDVRALRRGGGGASWALSLGYTAPLTSTIITITIPFGLVAFLVFVSWTTNFYLAQSPEENTGIVRFCKPWKHYIWHFIYITTFLKCCKCCNSASHCCVPSRFFGTKYGCFVATCQCFSSGFLGTKSNCFLLRHHCFWGQDSGLEGGYFLQRHCWFPARIVLPKT